MAKEPRFLLHWSDAFSGLHNGLDSAVRVGRVPKYDKVIDGLIISKGPKTAALGVCQDLWSAAWCLIDIAERNRA